LIRGVRGATGLIGGSKIEDPRLARELIVHAAVALGTG